MLCVLGCTLFAWVISCTVATSVACAQTRGFALNRFEPAERGSDWFTTESLDLRGDRRFAAGLVLDWASKPLVANDRNGDEQAALIRHQAFAHLGGNAVFWDRLRASINLPVLVFQPTESAEIAAGRVTPAGATALADVRLGFDLRLIGEYQDAATLAVGAWVYLPTGSRSAFASDGSFRVSPRVTLAGQVDSFIYSIRTGVNVRTTQDNFGGVPFGNEWNFGLALGFRGMNDRLTLGPEFSGSTVISDSGEGFFELDSTPLEAIFGIHYEFSNGIKAGLGAGPGLTPGLGSPQLRGLATVEWAPVPRPPAPLPPLDTDRDGIPDIHDACPTVAGPHSNNPKKHGCPPPKDRDADTIYDQDDACPDEAGVKSDNPDEHGCPPPPPSDADGDGIIDDDDACVNDPGPKNTDPKKHGCPLPKDTDADGIIDDEDACPEVAGPPDKQNPEYHGCPKAQIDGTQVKLLKRIEFDTGKATLRPESDDVLQAVLQILVEHTNIARMSVEGHTDNRGSGRLNRRLSENRARAVMNWLRANGIASDRLVSSGFGPDHPTDSNDTELGRQNNRRVEFHIIKTSGESNTTFQQAE